MERGAFLKAGQIAQLRLGDPGFPANGRMEIDSKRAADHGGNLELDQLLEDGGNRPC